MVKFLINNGSEDYPIEFNEDRIIEENNLSGNYEESIVDEIKQIPTKRTINNLESYGNGNWFASGTEFGIVKAGVEILWDEDKNNTQGGEHFNINALVRVDGQKPYKIPVGEKTHRIYSDSISLTFLNADGTTSGTQVINKP